MYAHSNSILDVLCEKQIVLDGKKLKGQNPKSKGNKGLYIVNAWVAENRLYTGKGNVDGKSNEITVIPEVLKEINLTDSVVTIDAIGCQKEIVNQIKEQGGHSLLSVKKNCCGETGAIAHPCEILPQICTFSNRPVPAFINSPSTEIVAFSIIVVNSSKVFSMLNKSV